ncbi:hypothetical protein AB1Y20_016747 [Prymnesium parvum]|uniref:Uncharacterized protein n=1 Tax=Prymnesium parvum TaxID=97485 RepID=A0AB34IC66_PRYPA
MDESAAESPPDRASGSASAPPVTREPSSGELQAAAEDEETNDAFKAHKRRSRVQLATWGDVGEDEPPRRRSRNVVNYSDKTQGPKTSDLIVAELEFAAASSGLDLPALATRIAERTKKENKEKIPPHFSAIRQSLIGLLRSGRVRRRLTVGQPHGDTTAEAALALLVLNTLQVESDIAAPWSLRPREAVHARGAALVGRRVEVWWEGDGTFHSAAVEAYNETGGAFGRGKTHTVVYSDGLRCEEDLEGPGEPALWRLLEEEAAGVEEEPAEEEAEEEEEEEERSAETVWPQPRLEQMHSVATIRNNLPITSAEASTFQVPPGWTAEQVPGSRRPKWRWVQRDAEGAVRRSFERREQLEEALEREAIASGGAWLGQLGGGVWEIRPKAVLPALAQVLKRLTAIGQVSAVLPQQSGKNQLMYIISNRYFKGVPFPRKERSEEKKEEEKEELCDLELERQRNMARNQELLRMLGLA